MATAIAACVMSVGMVTAGAYFTDSRAMAGNTLPGTVTLDVVSSTGQAAPTFTVGNLIPLASADALATTKGSFVSLKVKGASLPTRARVTLQAVDTGTNAALLPYVQMQIWNGARWSTAVTPSTTSAALSDEFTVAGGGESSELKIRLYLKAETPNSLQGATLKFTLGTRSIQAVAPAATTY